jgi:hypothetical protein
MARSILVGEHHLLLGGIVPLLNLRTTHRMGSRIHSRNTDLMILTIEIDLAALLGLILHMRVNLSGHLFHPVRTTGYEFVVT